MQTTDIPQGGRGGKRPASGRETRTRAAALTLAALGVVFGDIGTSPLYAVQTVFSTDGGIVTPTAANVYGVISLIFWSLTLVVSLKYVIFLMRASLDGEGGVMVLTSLARRSPGAGRGVVPVLVGLGILGVSLFLGDALITPAISVISAVEGLDTISPSLSGWVVPIAAAVLAGLFLLQRRGAGVVGRFFGPVMALWMATLAAGGLAEVVREPTILRGLSPTYALEFLVRSPFVAFIAIGAVVLAVTGAEALYADMGQLGRPAIVRAWFFVVFPALTLNYLGQNALILRAPGAVAGTFFLLYPHWSRVPLLLLSTVATVIASQAVISGMFSITSQAVQLGYLPRIRVVHTSEREFGQIYVPVVNWALFVGVLAIVLTFQSSARLAAAYGFAVTGTFLISTTLFVSVLRNRWHKPLWMAVAVAALFLPIDTLFFTANARKIPNGAWLPLAIAAVTFVALTTWWRGREIVTRNREAKEGSLPALIEEVNDPKRALRRVPGCAVFLSPSNERVPLAMRANVDHNHILHENVVIASVESQPAPHVPPEQRVKIDDLGHRDDGIIHAVIRFGFLDRPDVHGALTAAREAIREYKLDFDPDTCTYFVSRITLRRTDDGAMPQWRKRLFIDMARQAGSPVDYFSLPAARTVVMGAFVEL